MRDCASSAATTAPAQAAVEWEVKTFTAGREDKTPYQGYGDDVDDAWGELYNREYHHSSHVFLHLLEGTGTILKIPKSEAVLLPNKTYPIKEEPGYCQSLPYASVSWSLTLCLDIAALDVFHQLHCLVSSVPT